MLVMGADLGGTGARAALAENGQIIAETTTEATDRVIAVKTMADDLMAQARRSGLGAAARDRWAGLDAVAVGATGFFLRGKEMRERLPEIMFQEPGARQIVLCSDMVTQFLGALGMRPGAVIAAGTGSVALGSDLRGTWKRVDGWGYLVGDFGGGSWIGRAALQAALRADDGRPGGSAPLLAGLREHFGEPGATVAGLASREDRAGAMAGFVPYVASAAEAGDPIAARILADAGGYLAETGVAALIPTGEKVLAMTGNLFQVGAVREAFTKALPDDVDLRQPLGSGVDGALLLANAVLMGTLPPNTPCEQFTSPV